MKMRKQLRSAGLVAVACAALFGAGACAGEEPATEAKWEVVFDDLDASAFSVWGSAADDVWVVGADDGTGPLILHYDGTDWARMQSGAEGDLWWVSGRGDDVWMSGEAGLILRYSRKRDEFESLPVETESVLFGIFPAAKNDVWAVGGDLSENLGEVLRFDGSEWSQVQDVPSQALQAPLFKVWGAAEDDVWFVGLGEVALHFDGEWRVVDVPTGRRLLTVHGNAEQITAVGGFASGLLVEQRGNQLEDRTPLGLPQLNSVWVTEEGRALAGGTLGALWERVDGKWSEVPEAPDTRLDYHSVYVDPSGGEWAVGGQITIEPFDQGIVAHRGTRVGLRIRTPK